MACTIVRNKETGKIDHVKAPNGERSRLFESIRIAQPNWSDEQLLREYAKYYTTEFQDKIKEAKRLDSSFDLDLDEKLRNVLINLYPEIELAYTNDIIQPADINSVFNQLEEQYREVKTETTNKLNDLLSEVPDNLNDLNETIIINTDEKLVELLRSQNPNANLTHFANNLVAINTPAYRNYEYNKRLYQIQEYKKQLTNRNDVKGLEILSELEKLLTQNKNSFSQNLVDFLNYDARKALTGNTYNVASGIALEFVMGSLPAGLVLTTLAFAAPTLGPFFIIGAAMSTWGGYTLSKIAYNITKGFSKRKKATDIIKRVDYVTELLNLDVLIPLQESLINAKANLFHNIWMSDLDKLANTVNEKGENVYSTDYAVVEREILRLGKVYSTEKILADKQIYRDYYNINEQLEIINSLTRKLERNPVFLKEIEIDHRFKALVEEIYTLSDEKINNIEQLTAQNIAENVLVAINPDGSNIQNSDLKRIFIRSGLARNYNDRFSQKLFKEDLVNILMAEEIKIKGNTSAYKMDVLYALGQSLEGLDFRTDDLLRKYLADSVEDATNSLEYFSDYQIANTSFGEIFDKINNSNDFRQREFYKSVYRQKNEALFNDKSNFNIFQFIKSKFYKTLLNQSGYDSSNIQFQRLENKILGQANIKAMTVLINAVDQKQDTLPHEYAHHYIAWYRHTPIVQEAIAKWGSEEALVQAIGEQAVKQQGEAWTWWKNFVEWILSKFAKLSDIDKETLKNALTDAFLTRTDLNTIPGSPNAGKVYLYRLQEKDFDINTNTIQRAEQLISEGKAKWWHEQIAKNPERRAEMEARDENYGQWFTDAVEKLDYYLEDKEGELEILRITVDKKDLDKYNVGKSGSPNAKRFSNRHHDEFIVPKEIIEKAERFNVSDIPALILDRIPTNNERTIFNQTIEKQGALQADDYESNNEFYQLNEDQKSDFIEGLDNYLISFLEQFGVAVKDINEFKNRRGVNALGVTDTLNKIVYYSQNRNKYTLPEEAAHMLLFLAGLNNDVINEFIRDIQFWDGYDAIHKKYAKIYNNDVAKIKLEAAGQLLSQILVEEYKASGISDKIIQGVKNAVNSILDMFKNIFKVPKTADDISGYSYNLGRKIARKILEGDIDYITKLPDNLKKLKYDNVVKPNTFVKDVIDDFTSLDPNIKISGSLALSLQGDVYRESDVTVHDLDFVVVGDDAETKLLNHLKNKYSTITINQFDNDSYRVNQFFVTKKENILIPAVGSDIDNMEFEGLRLADGTMVAVDNDNTLVIDIFVRPESDRTEIGNKSYTSWEHIFISKQNLGSLFGKTFTGFRREKDQRDFNYFDTPKDVRYQNEDNLFYQLDDDGHIGNFQLFEEVDKLCPNGICNYTAKKSTEYLESIGLNPYPTNYNGSSLHVSVKSPLGDFNVIHYVSAVAINDNIYIYDMPQHEFISNEFFGRESDVKLKETYKPRLIPLTLEDIESNYNLSTKEAGHFIKTLLDNRGQNVGYIGEIPPFTKYIETNIKDSVEYISILKDQIEKSGYKEYNNRTYNYPEYLKRLKEVKNSLLNKKLTTEEEDKVIRYFENKLKLRTRDYIPSKTNKFDIIKLLDSIIGMPNYFRRALSNISSQSLNDTLNDIKRYISSEEFITDVIEVKERLELNLNSTNKLYDEVYRVSRIMEDFAKLVKTYGVEEALNRYDSRLQYEIRVLLPSNILEKYYSKEQASLMLARYWSNKDNIVKQISSEGYKNYKTLVDKRLKEHSKFNKINTLLNYLISVEYDTDYLFNVIANEARRRYNYFNKIDKPHFRLDENNEPIYTPDQTNTESIPEILHEIKYQHSFYHLANLGAELSNINNIPNIETYEEELLGEYSSRYDYDDKVIYTKKDLNKFDKYTGYLKSYFEASATNTLTGMSSIHQEMLNNILDNAYDRLKEKGADQIPGFNKAKLLNSVFNNSYLIGLLKKTPAISEYRDLVSPNVENPSLYMQLIKVIANVNGVSNNNLPVLDQILSTRADLVKENDNLAAKPDLYFNLQDQYDSPESARLGYNELMQMVIASELEDNVDLNESNYPPGTKNEAIQQVGHTEEQKQAFEKIKKESDKIKRTEVVTIEQLEQAAKGTNKKTAEKVRLLKKFVDSTARYVIVDEEGVEKIIPLRPSDLGKLVFAEKRNFNKEDITRMDSSRDSILSRGMGTTMHKVQQLLINEIDKQNEDNSILSFQTLGDVKDFYNNNYLKVINNTTDPELKEIIDSLNKKGTYSKEYTSEELLGIVDVNVPKEDRTFTFDKTDFENLAYLAFKLYHQVYKIQFDLDANSNIKHKPIILTETKVVDEDNGIAGAIDLLVVYTTDKELKYGFYDYKFINFEREMDILQTKPDEETIKKQKITTQYRNKAGKIIELDPSALKSKDYNPYLVANKLRAKYQSFDLQITAYKDILTKGRYGILKSQIMESRVIPVNMMFKKVKDGETYKRIPTIKFLDHDHELLSQIPFANELTNDTKINEFIELLFTKRAELYKLRERKRDDERINDRITDLDYIIKTLQVKKDIKAVAQRLIQIGDAIEGAIANGKESDNVFGKMYATDEDLVFYEEMIKLYDNFSSYVTYEYDKLRKEAENSKDPNKEKTFKQIDDALAEQNFKIKSLLDKIRTVRDERLLSYADSDRVAKIQDNFDVELNINSKDLRNMGIGSTAKQYLYSDISWIQATLYGISDWDNPLAFMGKQILDNINYEVKEYTESIGKRIEEHRNALVEYAKRKGISPMAVFELFINRIGNKALFVSKLDSEFYKERAKAIDEKDLKWLKQNLVFDKEKFDKAYKKYEDRLLTKYHLKDLSGKDTITNNVKYQLKAFESKFNAEKSEFAYYTDRNYFLKANPQAEIKYESNKWKTIKANKELLDFYNFYLEMIDEIKDLTGDARINSLFIPQIHRDTADILSNNFFSFDAIKNVYTSFVESNKLRTEDEAIGLVINDQVMDDVPLRYADPINIDNLLTDLTKSLMLMSYSAKTYQMAELAKGTLEAIRMAIADTKFTERDTLGNKKQGKLVEGSVSKLYEAYSKQLKYHLYGQTLQSTKLSRMSGIETGTLGRVNPIKVLRDVMSFYSKKSLAFNMTSIVGGHFNVKSQLRQLAKKEQHFNLKTLNETEKIFGSINREAHIFNEMFKISQEGNAGLIFEQANRLSVSKLRQVWNKPISYFFQRRSDDAMDAHLLYTMLKSYALHPDGKTVFPISKKNKFLKGTEWENAEIKSMWDSLVFDENATDPNAKITIKSFDGSTEMTKLQFMTFRERTRKLMSRARGNVSNEDIANYRNTLEGQVLGQFKGWVPTTLLLERFGQARYNFTLDELEIGRYRVFLGEFTKEGIMPKLGTFAKMLTAVALFKSKNLADSEIVKGYYNRWRLENPELADKVSFEDFMQTWSSQLAAFAAEIRMYLLIKLSLLGIGFAAGDKEEKRNPAVRTLMTWLDRVALEIGFYFDPSQTVQIVTRGPLPLLNMVNELRNLLGNSLQEIGDFIAGAEKDKKISFLTPGDEPFTINIFEEKPDRTPPFTYIFRFVPGLKGISDLLELTKDPDERPTLLEWAFGVENYKYR